MQGIQPKNEPISARRISRTFSQQYTTPSLSRSLAAQLLTHVAHSILDHDTGKQLNYGQLRKHPKFQKTWNQSFSNEMGRLCQGVGIGKNNLGNRVEGPNTFHAFKFEDIPED